MEDIVEDTQRPTTAEDAMSSLVFEKTTHNALDTFSEALHNAFDESLHPRDETGRFSDSDTPPHIDSTGGIDERPKALSYKAKGQNWIFHRVTGEGKYVMRSDKGASDLLSKEEFEKRTTGGKPSTAPPPPKPKTEPTKANEPEPPQERASSGSQGPRITDVKGNGHLERELARSDAHFERMDSTGLDSKGNKVDLDDPRGEYNAVAHIGTVLQAHKDMPLSASKYNRFRYATDEDGHVVAAGRLKISKEDKGSAEITDLGSVAKGGGRAVVEHLVKDAKERGVKEVKLQSTAREFYERMGFKFDDSDGYMKLTVG